MKKKFLLIIIFGFLVIMIITLLYTTFSMNGKTPSTSFYGDILKIDEEAYGNNYFDNTDRVLKPILDKKVNISLNNIIYMNFIVGGNQENNIENITYDIAFVDLELDCELLSPYLKWKLIKNGEEISNGSFDYQFDTIKDGRLVLTNIQQDLKTYSKDKSSYDYYQLYIWLSDSFQSEKIYEYIDHLGDQSNLSNKMLKGRVEVELYANSKELLIRKPTDTLPIDTCIVRDSDNHEAIY